MCCSLVSVSSTDFQSMKASYCLISWFSWVVFSQGMPAGIGGWYKMTSQGKEVRKRWLIESTGEVEGRGRGRPQLMIPRSGSAIDESEALDLGKQRAS